MYISPFFIFMIVQKYVNQMKIPFFLRKTGVYHAAFYNSAWRIEQIDAFTGEDSKRIKRISDSTERNRKNEFINRLGKGISPA